MSFPAVASPARAHHRGIVGDEHVTEFAGSSVFAAIDLSVDDDAGTDALGDQYCYKISGFTDLFRSEPELCQGDGVCVVVDGDRKPGCLFDPADDVPV